MCICWESNYVALTSHETRRDGCAWRQEIHHSGWLCWDEEQIQSADSLVEPETFIIIITAPFTGLSAFLYGIIHHVISLTADYNSHQNGKKIQQRTAWALISASFFLSPAFYYSCSALWGNSGWKQTLLYILPPFQIPLLQTADVGNWPQQLFKLKEKEGGESEQKNCIELLPISCKHRMSSSHTKISDQKNSKKDWRKEARKEGRNRERKKEKKGKCRYNTIHELIHSRVVTQCHYLYL